MNKIFAVVKNKNGQFVVASELARGSHGGKQPVFNTTRLTSILLGSFMAMSVAHAQVPATSVNTGGLVGGIATGDGAVAIGNSSWATSENGGAQGTGSIATGGNITKEEFEAILAQANEEIAKRKELEAQREALRTSAESKAQSVLDLQNKIEGYNSIIQKDSANQEQLANAQNQLNTKNDERETVIGSQAYTDAIKNYNDYLANSGGTRVEEYANFPLLINSLDWTREEGRSLSDTLGDRLAVKIQQATPSIYEKYKAIDVEAGKNELERYRKIVDGYVNDYTKVVAIDKLIEKYPGVDGNTRIGASGFSGVSSKERVGIGVVNPSVLPEGFYDYVNAVRQYKISDGDKLYALNSFLPKLTNEVFNNIITEDGYLKQSLSNIYQKEDSDEAQAISFNSMINGSINFAKNFFEEAANVSINADGVERADWWTAKFGDVADFYSENPQFAGIAMADDENDVMLINDITGRGVKRNVYERTKSFVLSASNLDSDAYISSLKNIYGNIETHLYYTYYKGLQFERNDDGYSEISRFLKNTLNFVPLLGHKDYSVWDKISGLMKDELLVSGIDINNIKQSIASDILNGEENAKVTKENFYAHNKLFRFNEELNEETYNQLLEEYLNKNAKILSMHKELVKEGDGYLYLINQLQEGERNGTLSNSDKEELLNKIKSAKDNFIAKYSDEINSNPYREINEKYKNLTNNIVEHFFKIKEILPSPGEKIITASVRLSEEGVALYTQKYNEWAESRKEIVNDFYNLPSFNSEDEFIKEVTTNAQSILDAYNAEIGKVKAIDDAIAQLEKEIASLGSDGAEIADAQEKKQQAEAEIAKLNEEKEKALSNIGDLDGQIEELNRSIAEKLNLKSGQASLASGDGAFASGDNSLALGTSAQAVDESAIAIGTETLANGEGAIAIGKGSAVVGDNSISLGIGNVVKGRASIAIGDPNLVYGDNNLVLGNNNKVGTVDAPKNNNIIIGSEVDASNVENAIVLGNASTAVSNAVSIGTADATKQIKFVKAGADDTDAVNFGQLKEYVANNLNGTATGTPASSEELDGKANVSLNNLDDTGRANIRNIAQAAVTVANGVNTTVTVEDKDNVKTYKVNVSNEAIVSAAKPELDKKANRDGSNLTEEDVEKFSAKLNMGKIEMNNTGLVNGGQVYDYVNRAVSSVGMDIANYAIDQSKAYTDTQIKSLRREAFSGIAASAAIGSIQHVPNRKYSLGAGIGNYKGYSAIAVGFRAQSDNKKHLFGVSAASTTKGDVLTTANYSFGWD